MSLGYDAVVAGHLCLDIIPNLSGIGPERLAQMFRPGSLLEVGSATFATGGTVSNTGVALHLLGIKTRLMSKVGDDLFGNAIRRIVESYGPGLADGIAVDPAVRTAYTFVISPPGVDRSFLGFPGSNHTFGASDIDYEMLKRARLFHFGYPPLMKLLFENDGAQLAELFRRAKATGVTTSLDMALPDPCSPAGRADWRSILRSTLPYVDLFMPSVEEILYMLRPQAYAKLCQATQGDNVLPLITLPLLADLSAELLGLGVKLVCLKLGERGLYMHAADRDAFASLGRACPRNVDAWADQELWTPCFRVQVVGTTGAGDAAIAGLLSALLRDLPAADALTAAIAVGACNVEADDALSGVRPWEETLRRVAGGWPRHEPDFDLTGWRFDEGRQLWVSRH